MGRQYPISVTGDTYYLDLLFYHAKLHCYVVVELKAGTFMPLFSNPEIAKQFICGMGAAAPKRTKPCKETKCENCGGDLIYTEPSVVHLDPPRKRVKCTSCDFNGFQPSEDP